MGRPKESIHPWSAAQHISFSKRRNDPSQQLGHETAGARHETRANSPSSSNKRGAKPSLTTTASALQLRAKRSSQLTHSSSISSISIVSLRSLADLSDKSCTRWEGASGVARLKSGLSSAQQATNGSLDDNRQHRQTEEEPLGVW